MEPVTSTLRVFTTELGGFEVWALRLSIVHHEVAGISVQHPPRIRPHLGMIPRSGANGVVREASRAAAKSKSPRV